MIDFVHAYEGDEKPLQHPVIMSAQWPDGSNADLFGSNADAVVPFAWRDAGDERWEYEAPARHTGKVVFLDTDHLWGVGGTVDWAWRSFMRGCNPLYMDPWGYEHMDPLAPAGSEDVRRALGQARRLATGLDLGRMVPRPDIVSTGFALYDGDGTVVAYQPYEDRLCVDLGRFRRRYRRLAPPGRHAREPGAILRARRRAAPSVAARGGARHPGARRTAATGRTDGRDGRPRHGLRLRHRAGGGAAPGGGETAVAVVDLRADVLAGTAAEPRGHGAPALELVADVSDEDAVRCLRRGTARLGRSGCVVGAAGISMSTTGDARVDQLELACGKRLIATNLTGMFLTCKHAVG